MIAHVEKSDIMIDKEKFEFYGEQNMNQAAIFDDISIMGRMIYIIFAKCESIFGNV